MSAEQMQAVMTQIQHLVGVVGQLAQQQQQSMQWQQQRAQQNPAVNPPGLGPLVKARKLIDTRFVKILFFTGEGKDYEDWSFSFKRAMRAANWTTNEILATVERAGLEIGMWEGSSVAGPDGGRHGFRAWSKLYGKYGLKTMARAMRMVGQVTNPPKVEELMKWEKGQGFDQGVRSDLQRHGEGRDRRLDPAPGCPVSRVPVDRGQAGLRRGDGQDPVRRVQ